MDGSISIQSWRVWSLVFPLVHWGEPCSLEKSPSQADTTTIDRQCPKCWAETLTMSLQVTSNGTAILEVIFSTGYPGKASLSAAQRSRSNIQGSISPQTPSTATGAHKANDHRNWFLSHCAWTGRKKPDPGNTCYKMPDTLWHELNGLGIHFFSWDKWLLHRPGSCHLYVLLPMQFTQHHTLNP